MAGAGAWVMVAYARKPKKAEPKKGLPRVTAPAIKARHDYQMKISGFGSARPARQVLIVPEVLGKVVWRAEDAFSGRFVKEGQELFRIERKDYELAQQLAVQRVALLAAQLDQVGQEKKNLLASAQIESDREDLAKRVLADTRRLRKDSAVGAGDLDLAEEKYLAHIAAHRDVLNKLALMDSRYRQVQAEHAIAKVQLAQADLSLARATYVSPVTGRIRTWDVPAQQVLQAGRTYGEIYATGTMEIPVSVAAEDLQWLDRSAMTQGRKANEKDKTVRVTWHGKGPDARTWRGYVDRIEAGLVARTRTAVLVVRVDNDPSDRDKALDINMFCHVTIPGVKVGKVFVLDRKVIHFERVDHEDIDSDGYVYVVVKGKLVPRGVKVIRLAAREAIVRTDGTLREGDLVLTSTLGNPMPNMLVKVKGVSKTRPATGPARETASGRDGQP